MPVHCTATGREERSVQCGSLTVVMHGNGVFPAGCDLVQRRQPMPRKLANAAGSRSRTPISSPRLEETERRPLLLQGGSGTCIGPVFSRIVTSPSPLPATTAPRRRRTKVPDPAKALSPIRNRVLSHSIARGSLHLRRPPPLDLKIPPPRGSTASLRTHPRRSRLGFCGRVTAPHPRYEVQASDPVWFAVPVPTRARPANPRSPRPEAWSAPLLHPHIPTPPLAFPASPSSALES